MSDHSLEDTIKEIALKNNVALSKDDPILIMQTFNEILMKVNKEAQEEILSDYKSELEVMLNSWSSEAKNKAERTLNAAITASKDTINDSVKKTSEEIASLVKIEVENAINSNITPTLNESKMISYVNLATASMALISTVSLIYIALF